MCYPGCPHELRQASDIYLNEAATCIEPSSHGEIQRPEMNTGVTLLYVIQIYKFISTLV